MNVLLRIALAASFACPALGQLSINQIVAQGTPADMNLQTNYVGRLNSCNVVFTTDATGKPQLVAAAYMNSGPFSHLRMLSVGADASVSVIRDVGKPSYMLDGGSCRLELVNLNSDTGNNPLLSKVLMLSLPNFSSTDGEMTWFFAWNGGNFVNLGPTFVQNGLPPVTVFHNAGPIDLDHTPTLQIESIGYDGDLYAQQDGIATNPTVNLYSFNGSSFQQEKTLAFAGSFERKTGQPSQTATNITPDSCYLPACEEFEIRNPATMYKLTAINGSAAGKNRVSSAHVLLNNVEVISPSDLNQQVGIVSKTVQITQKNTVYASLDGTAGGTLTITIEPIR